MRGTLGLRNDLVEKAAPLTHMVMDVGKFVVEATRPFDVVLFV